MISEATDFLTTTAFPLSFSKLLNSKHSYLYRRGLTNLRFVGIASVNKRSALVLRDSRKSD